MIEEVNSATKKDDTNVRVHKESAPQNYDSVEHNFVRNKLENLQSTVLKDVENRMSSMIEEIMQQLREHELRTLEFKNFAHQQQTDTWNNRQAKGNWDGNETDTSDRSGKAIKNSKANGLKEPAKQRKRELPEKVFVTRESYLTALLEVGHMRSIYHIFYIILLAFFANSICYDYFVEGRLNFGLGTFKTGLSGIHYVFGVWLLEHGVVFTLYFAFKGWALVRAKLSRQQTLQRFWTHSCLIAYIASQLLFGYVATAVCVKLDLPFASASAMLLESVRLLMKMHAFVRTNAARVIAGKLKANDDEDSSKVGSVPMPPFSCYLYFLFAPTLIYRDTYPRTSQIRWKFALARFLEIVAICFLYAYIFERHMHLYFSNYGLEEMDWYALIVKLLGMLMPGFIIFLCGFYLILHSWLNFTSELLRFGDRMFYKDWWTSHTYDAYYRDWNVVVHDWLYEYIYKDFYNHVLKGSKVGASLVVFMVSALVHEHVLAFSLQVFFPVMFVFFGVIGVPLVFLTRKAPRSLGNLLLWFSLVSGNGTMIALYTMEYYARFNCPKTYDTWVDYLTPAVWNCYKS